MITEEITFQAWPKISRLFREVIVTEKIDGTNAAIIITEDGRIAAQSRRKLITPDSDNFGFAKWVYDNESELVKTLGPGRHFGEWWGSGIQRRYGLKPNERRFSLFNAIRWSAEDGSHQCIEAPLCHVVPVLSQGVGFDRVDITVDYLRDNGSLASPGFMNPEGIVVYHKPSNMSFKVTLENDEVPKGVTS